MKVFVHFSVISKLQCPPSLKPKRKVFFFVKTKDFKATLHGLNEILQGILNVKFSKQIIKFDCVIVMQARCKLKLKFC